MNASSTTRRITALAGSATLAAALSAGVASAQTQDTPVSAAITVPSVLTFTLTSASSFSVLPGATDAGAVSWTIACNSPAGYTVTEAAPDLAGPGGSLPAGDLTELMHYSEQEDGTHTANTAMALTNAPAFVAASNTVSGAAGNGLDSFSQDWTAASLPGSTVPGSYGTTISYVAAGQ